MDRKLVAQDLDVDRLDVTTASIREIAGVGGRRRREIVAQRDMCTTIVPQAQIPVFLGKNGMLVKLEVILLPIAAKSQIAVDPVPMEEMKMSVLVGMRLHMDVIERIVLNITVV
ncbi:MAG: hypothetical protein Q8L51_03930 [Candidatus Amesbacteria bacterium]|nr:hypothetical protein [Candidatus Amesbacteria bacterium]